jgi:isopentenyldiphosphate isomerase
MLTMMKPIKHAVSVIIQNKEGQTLFALRSPHKKSFPLTWSLPSHFMAVGERPQDTIQRIGSHKLGVELEPGVLVNEGYGERADFRLFMHDYTATVSRGVPHINSDDFIELKWSEPRQQLHSMTEMGDCCRLYKEALESAVR